MKPGETMGADCLITAIGIGMMEVPGEHSEQDLLVERLCDGLPYAFVEQGVHPDGNECQTQKLIGWRTLAEIMGTVAALRPYMPVDQRDQFDAHCAATVDEATRVFAEQTAGHE